MALKQALFQMQTINQLHLNIHCNVLKVNMVVMLFADVEKA
ncbi:hypothetical protein PPEP_a3918 [Pseudoalteromonas peptidolytica F12-50-A1]|uniref:Uncharacterized protein n=1 Tax=Pseudoalteromonas peptidolytica F12-50-A1 TaxID=1315280 RepID=A0A8I0MXM8_9GAMM|nr:hypothetical protein [Pseudoalteromonas peptidolytica F12-50-A1]